MIRFTAIVLLILLSGCVTRRASIDSAGIKVGDKITLAGESVVYECAPRASTADMWRSKPAQKRCLKLLSRVNQYNNVLERVAAGTVVTVSQIKYSNGIDTVFYLAYVRLPDSDRELIVYEFDLADLIGAPRHGR